jgi:hypothetical protein
MIVVFHEHIRMNLHMKLLCCFSQQLQEFQVVSRLIVDGPFLIAPGQDMIEGVWIVDA